MEGVLWAARRRDDETMRRREDEKGRRRGNEGRRRGGEAASRPREKLSINEIARSEKVEPYLVTLELS